jgi:hypothetical protein
MSYENSAGLGVNNQYGVRDTQDSIALSGGRVPGFGGEREDVVYFTGDLLTSSDVDTGLTIPAGARIQSVTLEIIEAMTMGNADNDIEVGTNGSVATNGAQFDNTNGAVGTYAPASLNGTWASEAVLVADTAVSFIVTGTTAGATGGKGRVVVRYTKI